MVSIYRIMEPMSISLQLKTLLKPFKYVYRFILYNTKGYFNVNNILTKHLHFSLGPLNLITFSCGSTKNILKLFILC